MPKKMLPVKVTEIIDALEREAAIPQWEAALHLRKMKDYDSRTLVCLVETEPVSEVVGHAG